MKNILFICFVVLLIISVSGIATAGTTGYTFNGDGAPEYPNEGYITTSSYIYRAAYDGAVAVDSINSIAYDTKGNVVNYNYTASSRGTCTDGLLTTTQGYLTNTGDNYYARINQGTGGLITVYGSAFYNTLANRGTGAYSGLQSNPNVPYSRYATSTSTVYIWINKYKISGDTGCFSGYVELIIGTDIIEKKYISEGDSYSFNNLLNDFSYYLNFSDGHQYEFTCIGEDLIHDHDACSHTKYRFKESCNNLIPDSEGLYIENEGVIVLNIQNFYEPEGILDISNSSADHIYIYSDTFIGKTAWVIDPVVPDTEYTLINPNIAWALKVIVQNESDGALINDALVKVDQTCYCTSGYSTRQKMTVNGMCEFGDMSLQDASLFVMKSGYKICDENSTGYSAFLSGRTNFSSKTWVVKLAPSASENVTTFYEVSNKVDIHFRDINGNRTSQILDTDSDVYLYYENNNTANEAMTLKFQSSSTHSYFSDELSWVIAHDDIGHKTIANSYFTPWDYSYRAVIYNSSIYGWNITRPLTVRNATKETTLHYENLTTQIFFMGASDGKIDYREDMNIGIHACSNNTTLMYVDVELYKNNSLLCYKNLTASDFINADFQYWYIWNPIYEYEAGANYSIRMFGFDRTLLETDYIKCVADEITRKNKLTIVVKNRFGTNLDNAFVYLEGYGALPTGVNSYASYEGLDAGYYRYKATKAGYDAAGWDDVTLSDGDEIRTYILTEITSATGADNQPVKADDGALRNLYIMLMSFLLIFVLFGGFLYVIK